MWWLIGSPGVYCGGGVSSGATLCALYGGARVPHLSEGPGFPRGTVCSTPVELHDVCPPLVDLAGLPKPPGLEGRSLRPLLANPGAAGQAYSLVYHYDVARRIDVAGRTVIGPRWRYTEWGGGEHGRELYWRPDAPEEYHNRNSYPDLPPTPDAVRAQLSHPPHHKPRSPPPPGFCAPVRLCAGVESVPSTVKTVALLWPDPPADTRHEWATHPGHPPAVGPGAAPGRARGHLHSPRPVHS